MDARQGHLLLHMQLEPWIAPCVSLGWWFSPQELWGIWLIDIVVLPMRLKTPSATSVLSLTPPLGTTFSVQLLAISTCLCICQALGEPLWRQLYQSPVKIYLLVSPIVSGFGDCMWDGSPCVRVTVSGWPILQSLLHTCLCISSYEFPLLIRTEASTFWSSVFLSFKWSVECILGILSFWSNINL